jgi:hypothetical protein
MAMAWIDLGQSAASVPVSSAQGAVPSQDQQPPLSQRGAYAQRGSAADCATASAVGFASVF